MPVSNLPETVDEMIAAGAVQVSRKYRRVFIPPGEPIEWLKTNRPEVYDRLIDRTLDSFRIDCRDMVRSLCPDALVMELSIPEYKEFAEKTTGKAPWSAEGKIACPDCRSFGHIHRSDCQANKSVPE